MMILLNWTRSYLFTFTSVISTIHYKLHIEVSFSRGYASIEVGQLVLEYCLITISMTRYQFLEQALYVRAIFSCWSLSPHSFNECLPDERANQIFLVLFVSSSRHPMHWRWLTHMVHIEIEGLWYYWKNATKAGSSNDDRFGWYVCKLESSFASTHLVFVWRREDVSPLDELRERITFIEQDVNQRFDQIEQELRDLKKESVQVRPTELVNDERFLKLCHAVDYLLENSNHDHDTLACREMILSLLGQKSARPFSGRTIRNRQLCKRMKRWCLFVAFILCVVAGLAIYGLHRNWCYLIVVICLLGSTLSSIGLRRIYRIIEAIW